MLINNQILGLMQQMDLHIDNAAETVFHLIATGQSTGLPL
jgi:hypothetical protein